MVFEGIKTELTSNQSWSLDKLDPLLQIQDCWEINIKQTPKKYRLSAQEISRRQSLVNYCKITGRNHENFLCDSKSDRRSP